MEDSDDQCNYNRKGILCGQCSEDLSRVLGNSRCKKCTDTYLVLLLLFAAAGVILVAFLLLLNLTVAVGTINGLIFYANVVAANDALIFPSDSNTYVDILRVFIAWINLDFGIESCLYDGMDTYALTWLQYAFPLYLWVLIGLVFVVSHFSSRASRVLGRNPVAVFATLILLSYAKILRTVIVSFSSAALEYPEGEIRRVWLYDGSIPFLDVNDGRHLGLFIASLLVLVLLFIPYTVLLLTSQWLLYKSHWRILSWINKPQLRAFLDAHHAPFKTQHRYWTGVLLLARLPLLITSTIPNASLLTVQIFILSVHMWMWIVGGVYRKWYLNALEGFFFVSLGLHAVSAYQISAQLLAMELSSAKAQMLLAAISGLLVTAAIIIFLALTGFHVIMRIRFMKSLFKFIIRKRVQLQVLSLPEQQAKPNDPPHTVTQTFVSLRESLLEEP